MRRAALFSSCIGIVALGAFACGGQIDGGIDLPADGGALDATTPPTSNDGSVATKDGGTVNPGDATVVPPVQPTPCGDAGACDPTTQVCCVTFQNQKLATACVANGQCQGSSLSCTSASNCPNGQVCCAGFQGGGGGGGGSIKSTCKTQCAGGFQEPQLCAVDSECPQGQKCQLTQIGVKACVGGGGGGPPPPPPPGH